MGGDEVPYSATAFNLARHGVFARPIHPGPFDLHIRDYFPPVPILLMAESYFVFGFGVWQTKIVGVLCGLATTVSLFFLARCVTSSRSAAVLATLLFILNPVTFFIWQEARNEAPFTLAMAVMLLMGVAAVESSRRQTLGLWFAVGVAAGILTLAYYPFAGLGCLLLIPLVWSAIRRRSDRRAAILSLVTAGLLSVGLLFAAHVAVNPRVFLTQIVFGQSQYYLSNGPTAGSFWNTIWHNIQNEPMRYRSLLVKWLAGPELLIGVSVLVGFPLLVRRRLREWGIIWCGLIVWLGFLSICRTKKLHYLATPVLLISLGAAVIDQILSVRKRPLELRLWHTVVCCAILAGLFRVAGIGYTLKVQWAGRDYETFTRSIRQFVPKHASVVGPQIVWYPLAESADTLRLYTQGGPQMEFPTGELELNDPAALRGVTHIVLEGECLAEAGRLPGLRHYAATACRKIAVIRMPFVPLRWAPSSPFDVEVYECPPIIRRKSESGRNV